jgi:hypothetical protein
MMSGIARGHIDNATDCVMGDSYRKRMTQMDKVAVTSSRTKAKRLRRELKRDPLLKADIASRTAEAKRIWRAQLESGAQFAADQQLRYHLNNTNSRAWSHGLRSMPSSFNVTEAFFTYDAYLNLFRLLPESDYLISSTDFFDFVTAPGAPNVNLDAAYDFKEGVIYNFSVIDDPREFMAETSAGNSYALISTSMIRRADELCVMLTSGAAGSDLDELQSMAHGWDEGGGWLKSVRPDPTLKTGPVMLEQYPELLRVEAMARFDLRHRTIDARYLFLDGGSFFKVITDDDIMYEMSGQTHPDRAEAWDKQRKAGAEGVEQRAALFELMKTVVLLPGYLRAKVTLIEQESKPTKLSQEAAASAKAQKEIRRVPEADRVLIRRISALRVIRPHASSPIGRSYTPPRFQVPVDGFWRQFSDPERVGHDAAGNEIKGRTWVREHTRYRDNPTLDAPKIVYLKSSLASAKKRLENWRRAHSTPSATPTPAVVSATATQDAPVALRGTTATPPSISARDVAANGEETRGAYVYVMRCPAHGADIYKVGYSAKDPELRARELSAATASPVKFLLVQAWAVTNGNRAEAAAHSVLELCRLAENREFFQAKYSDLRAKLETAIAPWLIT